MLSMRRLCPLLMGILCPVVLALGCSREDYSVPEVDVSQLPPGEQFLAYCVKGDLANVKKLVEAYPEIVAVRGGYNRTPLHFAAAYGHKDVVNYLLENGADPTALDEYSETPADAAAQEGHIDIVKILHQTNR